MNRNHKQNFDFLVKNKIRKQEDDVKVVERLVNLLLQNLFRPCEDERAEHGCTFSADAEKLKKYGLDKEPINWGDLKVCEVIKDRDSETYIVSIEEASPDGCPALCEYVEKFMELWGWNVNCKTEW